MQYSRLSVIRIENDVALSMTESFEVCEGFPLPFSFDPKIWESKLINFFAACPNSCRDAFHVQKSHRAGQPPHLGRINLSPYRKSWNENQIGAETQQLLRADADFFLHQAMSTPYLNVLRAAKGAWIEDVEGRRYLHASLRHGLNFKVSKGNILTFAPPLNIKEEELDQAWTSLEKALAEVEGK